MQHDLILENTVHSGNLAGIFPEQMLGTERRRTRGVGERKVEREKLQGLHFSQFHSVNHCRICCGQANRRTVQRIKKFRDNESEDISQIRKCFDRRDQISALKSKLTSGSMINSNRLC